MISNFEQLVVNKISRIVLSDKKIGEMIYSKWGINPNNISTKLLDFGLHGGAWSKKKSLEHIPNLSDASVLNIGPEIGVEVFLLNELARKVLVVDPDESNLVLLEKISKKYTSESGVRASKKTRFLNFGFNFNTEKLNAEKRNYEAVVAVKGTGFPTFYNLKSNGDVLNLKEKFDVIFIHKIIFTLVRFTKQDTSEVIADNVPKLVRLLRKGGILSWTEPEYLFGNLPNTLEPNLKVHAYEYNIPVIGERYRQIITTK